jgi:hypothetical protein
MSKYPECTECGSETLFWRKTVTEGSDSVTLITDLFCTNPNCKNSAQKVCNQLMSELETANRAVAEVRAKINKFAYVKTDTELNDVAKELLAWMFTAHSKEQE